MPHSFNNLNHFCQSAAERSLGTPVHTQFFTWRGAIFSIWKRPSLLMT